MWEYIQFLETKSKTEGTNIATEQFYVRIKPAN